MITVNCNLCGRDDWFVRFPATLHTLDMGMSDDLGNGAGAQTPSVAAFRCTSPGYGSHPQIVQCRHCGLVYANPRWSPEEILAAYTAVEDDTYVAEREGRELTFSRHLRVLERIIGPAEGRRLLDVGAYIGVFVEVAAAGGWDAWGVEPSEWAAAEAQQRGLNVIQGTLDTLRTQPFDVITMWDVIEHLTDPAAVLRQIHDRLRPGGWVAVHTMDIDAPIARLMGARWPWLMDMHLYYFSRRTLAAMLAECGFEPAWTGAQGRYLRLGYLSSRVAAFNPAFGRIAGSLVQRTGLQGKALSVNFGDLLTMVARRR
jgi:2-polyprenyl-3-methyl-5-hydroxy-6-metoxy-1,4-benzoquinol methylase